MSVVESPASKMPREKLASERKWLKSDLASLHLRYRERVEEVVTRLAEIEWELGRRSAGSRPPGYDE